jgi:hypothetical protein
MLLQQIITRIDLNCDIDSLALTSQGAANERRTNYLFATHGLSARLNFYTLLQILSISLFEKMPILQAFSQQEYKTAIGDNDNQLNLFDL